MFVAPSKKGALSNDSKYKLGIFMAFHVSDLFYNILNKRKNSFICTIVDSAKGMDKEPITTSLYMYVVLIFL